MRAQRKSQELCAERVPRWSPQKRPYEVTSKPAIAIGRRRDCFLPCLGVSGQVAIVAVWAGTCVQMSVAAKNGAILAGLWRCFRWQHATTSGISPRSGPDDSPLLLSLLLSLAVYRAAGPGSPTARPTLEHVPMMQQ